MVQVVVFIIRGIAMETVIDGGVRLLLVVCCVVLRDVVVGLLAGVSCGNSTTLLNS